MSKLNGDSFHPLEFNYDEEADVLTVEGIRYSGNFFRFFAVAGPSDDVFRVVERHDGVVVIQKVED